MQEEELYRWWQYYARSGKTIYSQGRRLRVLNSGTLNICRGPDFISARFELDGMIYQGDVECHRKTSDWYAHHHHLDKLYRQVILHLVGHQDHSVPVKSQWSQDPIATLPLPKPVTSFNTPECYCKPNSEYHTKLKSNLMALALIRFEQKMNRFIKSLHKHNNQELFYIHFFRTLGYPANANSFQLLAEQLNWSWLMEHKNILESDYHKLFAVYAGLSGFIKPECRDSYSQHIRQEYHAYKFLLPGLSFDPDSWQYAGVRPYNHPHSRLANGLHILQHHRFDLFNRLIHVLQKRRDYAFTLNEIINLFQIRPEKYWQTHYALGKQRNNTTGKTSMGEARIIELLINVVLPMAAVKANLSGSEGFLAYLQSFYLFLPLVSAYGCLRKGSSWFDDCFEIWPTQAVNQSLLVLQSEYCHMKLCSQCPVKRHKG
ncbi:MAG: DUF2851 family protein [Calditrichaceae bacterium]